MKLNEMMEEYRLRCKRMREKEAAPTYEETREAEDEEKREAAITSINRMNQKEK